jgi:hypothetical protein
MKLILAGFIITCVWKGNYRYSRGTQPLPANFSFFYWEKTMNENQKTAITALVVSSFMHMQKGIDSTPPTPEETKKEYYKNKDLKLSVDSVVMGIGIIIDMI